MAKIGIPSTSFKPSITLTDTNQGETSTLFKPESQSNQSSISNSASSSSPQPSHLPPSYPAGYPASYYTSNLAKSNFRPGSPPPRKETSTNTPGHQDSWPKAEYSDRLTETPGSTSPKLENTHHTKRANTYPLANEFKKLKI